MAASLPGSIDETLKLLSSGNYVADRALATVVFLALRMGRPILLEGEAGVGKTEIAKVLAQTLGRRLIRLQCYEGLDVASAVYEWNYAGQMMAIRLAEAEGAVDRGRLEHDIVREQPRYGRVQRHVEHESRERICLCVDRCDLAIDARTRLVRGFQRGVRGASGRCFIVPDDRNRDRRWIDHAGDVFLAIASRVLRRGFDPVGGTSGVREVLNAFVGHVSAFDFDFQERAFGRPFSISHGGFVVIGLRMGSGLERMENREVGLRIVDRRGLGGILI